MKTLIVIALFLGLANGSSALAQSYARAQEVDVAALGACPSRTLNIEINVDGLTPKYQIIEAIKLLADYPNFVITPAHSEQSAVAFHAKLDDNCASDSCARALGWDDLQSRLDHFKGVAVTCVNDQVQPRRPVPMPAPGMPGPPGAGKPPRKGGVISGN